MLDSGDSRESRDFHCELTACTRNGGFELSYHSVRGMPLENFRLVHVSDFHLGLATPLSHLEKAFRIIENLKPDLVFASGDFIQLSSVRHFVAHNFARKRRVASARRYRRLVRAHARDIAQGLASIQPRHGVFAVLGNHDYDEGVEPITEELQSGVCVLVNEERRFYRGEQLVNVLGLDDPIKGTPDWEMLRGLRRAAEGQVNFLLCHTPDIVLHPLLKHVDAPCLAFSGHTHGGQICLPFRKPIYTCTKQRGYVSGVKKFSDSVYLHTSRGLGYQLLPFRVFCPPDISVFDFVS